VLDAWQALDEVAAFAQAVRGTDDALEVLHRLTVQVRQALQVPGASASFLVGSDLRVVTAAPHGRLALGRLLTEGPSLTAVHTGCPVVVPNIGTGGAAWPAYCRAAAEYGIVAVAALPLRIDSMAGAIEVYDRRERDWTSSEIRTIAAFADVAVAFLDQLAELRRQRRLATQLQGALDSRVVVEQAKGLVAGQRGITTDQAFHVLRKYADDHNAPLRKVANAVVRLGLRP
jgi:GAF domain-containing protein